MESEIDAGSSLALRVAAIKHFLLYSNIHIPVVVAGLLAGTSTILKIPLSIPLILFCGAGAFSVYHTERAILSGPEDVLNQPLRVKWYREHHSFTIFSLLLALFAVTSSALWLAPQTIVVGIILGCIGGIYLMPYGKRFYRLKGHWLAKPVFVAACWTVGGVILPVVEMGKNVKEPLLFLLGYRFLLIASNVLLSDLPDRKGDAAMHLNTLSVRLPVHVAKRVAWITSCVALCTGLLFGILFMWPALIYLDLLGAVMMICIASRPFIESAKSSHFTYGYVVDLIIAWPLVSSAIYRLFNG